MIKLPAALSLTVTYRWVLLIVALFCALFMITPYQRGFNCANKTIQNPFQPLKFPTSWLFFCTLVVPIITIYVTTRFLRKGSYNLSSNSEVSPRLAKFCFGFMLNLTITEFTKRFFGRLRPHTYPFCHLNRYCPEGPVNVYVPSFTCENPDASSIYITNTRLSFYSGHSSLGSYAGTYLVCFLNESFFSNFSQYSLRGKAFIIALDLSIFGFYLYPGYTQWLIHWHHLTDVICGFSAGIFLALIVFNFVNKCIPRRSIQKESDA